MSNEIEKSNSDINKSNTSVGKIKIGQGMMAGVIGALSSIELPRLFNQLIIFLLDGSGSMSFKGDSGKSKGHEVHNAVANVIERLKESKNKSSFDVALWAFANETVKMFPEKPVNEYDLKKDCFNPCEFISDYSSTKLSEALSNANYQASKYFEKYKNQNTKVLVIILGDGAINDYNKCFTLKEEMSRNNSISFSTILFSSPNWDEEYDSSIIDKLKEDFSNLASTEADYMSTVDVEKIRNHMIQSITKINI